LWQYAASKDEVVVRSVRVSAKSSSPKGSLVNDGSLWSIIQKITDDLGVELFDVDLPSDGSGSAGAGVLRVYITRSKTSVDSEIESDESGGASEVSSDDELIVEGASDEEGGQPAAKRTGISLEQCSRVSKRILDIDESDGIIPEGCDLEVSSPGINRRLRRLDHFTGAVGERVRVKFRSEKNTNQVVTGVLEGVSGDVLQIKGEDQGQTVAVQLGDVKEARVDFRFE
jgi:ribosome maturation factor RimP